MKPPFHSSEENFRRFEPYIEQAVIVAPQPWEIIFAANVNMPTCVARLRDAIAAHARHNFASTIPRDKFLSLRESGRLSVSHDRENPFKVTIGPRTSKKLNELKTQPQKVLDDSNIDRLWSACTLISEGYLRGPLLVQFTKPENLKSIDQFFDVRVDENGDGTYTIT